MIEFEIHIRSGNMVFDVHPEQEVARILRELADKVESEGYQHCFVFDVNGNRVGRMSFYRDDE